MNNEERCRCGRHSQLTKPHCPQCGRSWLVSIKRLDLVTVQKITDPETGLEKEVKKRYPGLCCRHCGERFNLFDAVRECDAPAFDYVSVTQRRRVDEASEKLDIALKETGLDPEAARRVILERLLGTKS